MKFEEVYFYWELKDWDDSKQHITHNAPLKLTLAITAQQQTWIQLIFSSGFFARTNGLTRLLEATRRQPRTD